MRLTFFDRWLIKIALAKLVTRGGWSVVEAEGELCAAFSKINAASGGTSQSVDCEARQ